MRFKFWFLAFGFILSFNNLALAQDATEPVKKTIAVLSERKEINELVTASDVIVIDVDKAPADAITEPEQIIGKALRRTIDANKPIRPTDLKVFALIKKGDMVTIQLQTPNMDLTATGKSLDNGAIGETVRVTNLSSNRTIFAKVVAPNTVKIESTE